MLWNILKYSTKIFHAQILQHDFFLHTYSYRSIYNYNSIATFFFISNNAIIIQHLVHNQICTTDPKRLFLIKLFFLEILHSQSLQDACFPWYPYYLSDQNCSLSPYISDFLYFPQDFLLTSVCDLTHMCRNRITFFFLFKSFVEVHLVYNVVVNFSCTTNCFSYTCTHIHSFSDSSPTQTITEYWGVFSVLYSRSQFSSHFIYCSVHLSMANP